MNSASIDPEGTCNFELSPEMETHLIDFFNIKIEVLQGSRELLPDGRIHLVFNVTDLGKRKLIHSTIMMALIYSTNPNVNPN